MARTNKERLAQAANRAARIQTTMATTGWQDILGIIQAKYIDCMDSVLAKENAEARGAINAINEIMNDISSELAFGDQAREKYTRAYLKTTPGE